VLLNASIISAQSQPQKYEVFGNIGYGWMDDSGGDGGAWNYGGGIGFQLSDRTALRSEFTRVYFRHFAHWQDEFTAVLGNFLFYLTSAELTSSGTILRPYVYGGGGLFHYDTRFRHPHFVDENSYSNFGLDFGAGIDAWPRGRVSFRPEFRMLVGTSDLQGFTSGFAKKPWIINGSVTAVYHW
jgi:hypothetical protein